MWKESRSIIFGTILLALFATAGFAANSKPEANSKPAPDGSLFKSRCALCHGADGRGKTSLGQQLKAADLHSAPVQSQSSKALHNIILHGKGNMPPFEGQLTDEQIDQVLKFVRQFGKK